MLRRLSELVLFGLWVLVKRTRGDYSPGALHISYLVTSPTSARAAAVINSSSGVLTNLDLKWQLGSCGPGALAVSGDGRARAPYVTSDDGRAAGDLRHL